MEKYEKKQMKERVTLTISGVELNLVTEESPEYMEKLAEEIDKRVTQIVVGNTRTNKIDAALFCALDYLDAYHKQQEKINAERERADRFYREFCLLKEENAELKTLLGYDNAAGKVGTSESEEASEEA